MLAVEAGRVLTPLRLFAPGVILIDAGKILAVGHPSEITIPTDCEILCVLDKLVIPGFVDTHTHGGEGGYFGESIELTQRICKNIVSSGVTSLLPTLAGLSSYFYSLETYLDQIQVVHDAMVHKSEGAEILGIHMEGPYLNPSKKVIGSQKAENLRHPSVVEVEEMVRTSGNTIRKMTIAIELDGAMDVLKTLTKSHAIPSVGHSEAKYEEVGPAVSAGLRCATHVFNGMQPLHHRHPGLVGAVLTNDQINAELIADGQHVSPAAMKILLRCKGVENVHLVTDHTIWAGMPPGEYLDGGRQVIKEDCRAYVVGGTLIGGVAPMNACVRNLVQEVSCSLPEAVQMASINPARLIGVDDRKGSLQPGKDADLVVIDEEVRVYLSMVKGKIVFNEK